jgi:hypothetical protein
VRLQLIAAGVASMLTTSTSTAEPSDPASATASFRIYTDDDHVTVVSPGARVKTWLGPRTALAVDSTIDAVTGASVDVVTSASPATVHERRIELGTEVTRLLAIGAATSASAGVRVSHEHDYDALRATASAHTELAERNTTVELRYTAGHDIARAVTDPAFRRTRESHQLTATLSQLLDRRTVADVIAEGAWLSGYHASPYRQVRVEMAGWPLPMLVAEVTASRRATLAVAGRIRRALTTHSFVTTMYRFYVDDWSMKSHTVNLEGYHQVADRWLVGLLGRGYVQDGAAFYRAHYDGAAGIPALRTGDRTLGPMRSLYISATVDLTLRSDWHLVTAVGVLGSWFPEFAAQAERRALLTTASLTAPL